MSVITMKYSSQYSISNKEYKQMKYHYTADCDLTYHICSLIFLPSISMVRILKSIPMVDMKVVLNAASLKRNNTHVLPTPESPISSNLNRQSYVLAIAQKSTHSLQQRRQVRRVHVDAQVLLHRCDGRRRRLVIPGF